VLLPAQEILATLFQAAGFTEEAIPATRKRTSKKGLFEYVVSAREVGGLACGPSAGRRGKGVS
jgi:hypothetical protein